MRSRAAAAPLVRPGIRQGGQIRRFRTRRGLALAGWNQTLTADSFAGGGVNQISFPGGNDQTPQLTLADARAAQQLTGTRRQ